MLRHDVSTPKPRKCCFCKYIYLHVTSGDLGKIRIVNVNSKHHYNLPNNPLPMNSMRSPHKASGYTFTPPHRRNRTMNPKRDNRNIISNKQKKTNIKHKKPLPFIKPQIAFRLFFVSFLRKIYSWLSQSKWIIVKCHVFISSIFILFSTFVCLIWLLMWIAENTIFFFVKGPRSMSSALSPRALRGLCRFFTSRAFILIFVPLKVI